jgi:hypothetical protein
MQLLKCFLRTRQGNREMAAMMLGYLREEGISAPQIQP